MSSLFVDTAAPAVKMAAKTLRKLIGWEQEADSSEFEQVRTPTRTGPSRIIEELPHLPKLRTISIDEPKDLPSELVNGILDMGDQLLVWSPGLKYVKPDSPGQVSTDSVISMPGATAKHRIDMMAQAYEDWIEKVHNLRPIRAKSKKYKNVDEVRKAYTRYEDVVKLSTFVRKCIVTNYQQGYIQSLEENLNSAERELAMWMPQSGTVSQVEATLTTTEGVNLTVLEPGQRMKIDDPALILEMTKQMSQDERIVIKPVSVSRLPRPGPKLQALDLTEYELPPQCYGFILDKSGGFQIMLQPDYDEFFNPEREVKSKDLEMLSNGEWIGGVFEKHVFARGVVSPWRKAYHAAEKWIPPLEDLEDEDVVATRIQEDIFELRSRFSTWWRALQKVLKTRRGESRQWAVKWKWSNLQMRKPAQILTLAWLDKMKQVPEDYLTQTSRGQLETMAQDSKVEAEREATLEPSDEEVEEVESSDKEEDSRQRGDRRSDSGTRIGFADQVSTSHDTTPRTARRSPKKGVLREASESRSGSRGSMKHRQPERQNSEHTEQRSYGKSRTRQKNGSPPYSSDSSGSSSSEEERRRRDRRSRRREERRRDDDRQDGDPGGGERRHQSPGFTASSMRGSSRTETLVRKLQRATNIFLSKPPDHKASSYQRAKLELVEARRSGESHITDHAETIDDQFEEELDTALSAADDALTTADEKADTLERTREEDRRKKDAISRQLPKYKPTVWDCKIATYQRFKETVGQIISEYPTPYAAREAMLDLVERGQIRDELEVYPTAQAALDSLELRFGNQVLSGPHLIEQIKKIPEPRTDKEETDNIAKIRKLKAQLQEISCLELVTRDIVFKILHSLRPLTGKRLMGELSLARNLTDLETRTALWDLLDKLYTENTMWARTQGVDRKQNDQQTNRPTDTPKDTSRRHPRNNRKTIRRSDVDNVKRYPPCKMCGKSGHPTFTCQEIKSATLGQIKSKGLCPACLRNQHGQCTGEILTATGKVWVACKSCGHNKRAEGLHRNCATPSYRDGFSQNRGGSGPRTNEGGTQPRPTVAQPGVIPQPGGAPQARQPRVNRTQVADDMQMQMFPYLINPSKSDSAVELLDQAVILDRLGREHVVNLMHDTAASDTLANVRTMKHLAWHCVPTTYTVHGSTGSVTEEGEDMVFTLKMPDGQLRHIKALGNDMDRHQSYTLYPKGISCPPQWEKYLGTTNIAEPNQDLHFNTLTRAGVAPGQSITLDLLIGSDLACLFPREVDRYQDEFGHVTILHSVLIGRPNCLTGNRNSWIASGGDPNHPLWTPPHSSTSRRTTVCRRTKTTQGPETSYPALPLSQLSARDKLFVHFCVNSDQLQPHIRACSSCLNCKDCLEIKNEQFKGAVKEKLDEMIELRQILSGEKKKSEWVADLPFDEKKKARVPVNKEAATHRFLAMERSIRKTHPAAIQHLNKKIQEGIDAGFFQWEADFEKENPGELDGLQESFLPVNYALKDTNLDQKEGRMKARPVSDASYTGFGIDAVSVNESLVDLPDIHMKRIQELMVKFRTCQAIAMADIKSMFHRIRLTNEVVSMTKICWRKDGAGGQAPLETLLVLGATMGLKPVPAIASRIRARTASWCHEPGNYDRTMEQDLQDSYVDDLVLTLSYNEDPMKLCERVLNTESVFRQVNLSTSGWQSSLPVDLNKLVESQMDMEGNRKNTGSWDLSNPPINKNTELDLHIGKLQSAEDEEATGCLGVRWKVEGKEDKMFFRANRPDSLNWLKKKRGRRPPSGELRSRADIEAFVAENGITKAALLGLTMSLYDVLGLATPWHVSGKILYRELIIAQPRLGWEEQVPRMYHEQIIELAEDMLEIIKVPFGRSVVIEKNGNLGFLTLVLTADGSTEAGCALAYVHQEWDCTAEEEPATRCRLLMGTSKLLDLRHCSQVEGELIGSVLAAKLREIVLAESRLTFDRVITLIDSQTVMKMLNKSSKAYSIWAATRVSYIQRTSALDTIRHVPGQWLDHTADRGTRALKKPSLMMDAAYWEGEGTIDSPYSQWPLSHPDQFKNADLDVLDLDRKMLSKHYRVVTALVTELEQPETDRPLDNLLKKYKSLDKTMRIVMKVVKFGTSRGRRMLPHQLKTESQLLLLRQDYTTIGSLVQSKGLKRGYLIQQDNGVFYINGRKLSEEGPTYKVPLLASPKKSWLTRRILQGFHDDGGHLRSPAGLQAKLLRKWFVYGGSIAYLKELRRDCPVCKRLQALKGKALKQLMGPVQTIQGFKDTDTSIFTRQMIDLAGPIFLLPRSRSRETRHSRPSKYWIMVSVCLASKYTAASLIDSYSTDSVLLGWQTMMARFGKPREVTWDRAQNLAAAANVLSINEHQDDVVDAKMVEQTNKEVSEIFQDQGVTVHESVPYSSWRQGQVEVMIRELKIGLKQAINNQNRSLMSQTEFTHLLELVLAHLNSRPLILTAEKDPQEREILRPSFLTATQCWGAHSNLLAPLVPDNKLSRRARMVQERFMVFRSHVQTFLFKNYTSLHHMNTTPSSELQVGQVMVIMDKTKERGQSTLGGHGLVLGVIDEVLSPRKAKLRYWMPGSSKIAYCERSIQGLALISNSLTELEEDVDLDIVPDLLTPGQSDDIMAVKDDNQVTSKEAVTSHSEKEGIELDPSSDVNPHMDVDLLSRKADNEAAVPQRHIGEIMAEELLAGCDEDSTARIEKSDRIVRLKDGNEEGELITDLSHKTVCLRDGNKEGEMIIDLFKRRGRK